MRTTEKRLVLASASPRRRELLALGGRQYALAAADVDESPLPGEPAGEYTRRVADSKARHAAAQGAAGDVIIAADTTVVLDGRILGKPLDAAEAKTVLESLKGRSHDVITSLAIFECSSQTLTGDQAHTNVPMRSYTLAEMKAYIDTGDPFDKAGAYAIQHPGFHPVQDLQGCYANVVGLPLCHLKRSLSALDVELDEDLPHKCQQHFDYKCPVFERVLKGEL